jgi:hypothetical protein
MGAQVSYFVCAQKLLAEAALSTDKYNFTRDHLPLDDLVPAIVAVVGSTRLNCAYDLASVAPVRNFELVRRFHEKFGIVP